MRYQLVRTSPYLGGQIRWDIPLDSHYENGKHILRTKGLHIVPLNDDIPFREDNSWDCLKYDHSKNISNLYSQIGDAMFSSDGEYSTIHWLHQGNDLLDPYSHKYIMGARRIRYQRYGKQFAFLCPLWISEQTDPSRFYFVISVRVVGEERDHIARTIIRLGDDISNYMKKYLDKSAKYVNRDPAQYTAEQEPYQGVTDDLLNIKFDPDYAYITGISVVNGLPTIKNVSYIIPDMVNKEQPLMEFDNMLLSLFSSQKMIAQQLINLNFVFNIEDISYYLKKELLGKHITVSIRVGYAEDNDTTYNESSLIPLRDFYTDYKNIPGFRTDIKEYSSTDNVFKYMGDNNMLNYVHANKFTQPIFHWTMVENPEYIYNFYDGFSPVFKDEQTQELCRTCGHYYEQADISAPDHTLYNNAAYWCKYMDLTDINESYLGQKLKSDTDDYSDFSPFSKLIINSETNIAYLNNNRYDLNKMAQGVRDAFMTLQGTQGKHPTLYLGNGISNNPDADWGVQQANRDRYYYHLQNIPIDYVYEEYDQETHQGEQRYIRTSHVQDANLPTYAPDPEGDWVQMDTTGYIPNPWEDPQYPGVQDTYNAMKYHLDHIKIPVPGVEDTQYEIDNRNETLTIAGYSLQQAPTDMNNHDISSLLSLAQGVQASAQGYFEQQYATQGHLQTTISQYDQAYLQIINDEYEALNQIDEYYGEGPIRFMRQMVQAVVSGTDEGGDWSPADYDQPYYAVQAIEWVESYCQKAPNTENYIQGVEISSQYMVTSEGFTQGFTSEPSLGQTPVSWCIDGETNGAPFIYQPNMVEIDNEWQITGYTKYESEPQATPDSQTGYYYVDADNYVQRVYMGNPSIQQEDDYWVVSGTFVMESQPNILRKDPQWYLIDNDLEPPAPYMEDDEIVYFNQEPSINIQRDIDWNIQIPQSQMLRLLKYSELYEFNNSSMELENYNMEDYRYEQVVQYMSNYVSGIAPDIYSGIILPIDTYFETETTSHNLASLIAWMMSDTYNRPNPPVAPPLTYPGDVYYGNQIFTSLMSMELCSDNIISISQMLNDASEMVAQYEFSTDDFNTQTRDISRILDAWERDAYELCGNTRATGDAITIATVNYINGHYNENDDPVFDDGRIILLFINYNISNATYYQLVNFITEKGPTGINWVHTEGINLEDDQKKIIMDFLVNLYKCWVEPYRITFDKSVAIVGVDDMIDNEKPSEVNGWYIPQSDSYVLRYTGKLIPLFIDPQSETFVNYVYRYKQWQNINDPKVQKYNKQIESGLNPLFPSIGYYCFEERKDSLEAPKWYAGYGGVKEDTQENDHEPWEWEIFWKNDSKIIELPEVYQDHTEPMIPVNYDEDIEEKYMWGLLYKYIAGIMQGHSNWVTSGENGPELNLWLKHKMKELYSIHYDFEYASDEIQEGDNNLKVIYYVNFRLR